MWYNNIYGGEIYFQVIQFLRLSPIMKKNNIVTKIVEYLQKRRKVATNYEILDYDNGKVDNFEHFSFDILNTRKKTKFYVEGWREKGRLLLTGYGQDHATLNMPKNNIEISL